MFVHVIVSIWASCFLISSTNIAKAPHCQHSRAQNVKGTTPGEKKKQKKKRGGGGDRQGREQRKGPNSRPAAAQGCQVPGWTRKMGAAELSKQLWEQQSQQSSAKK